MKALLGWLALAVLFALGAALVFVPRWLREYFDASDSLD